MFTATFTHGFFQASETFDDLGDAHNWIELMFDRHNKGHAGIRYQGRVISTRVR